MTVHGAKGLEAEIVILADAADMPKKDQTGLFLADNDLPVWSPRKLVQSDLINRLKDGKNQRALEEHKRLLYVALTRAKDELYIAASLTAEESDNGRSRLNENSWYAFIRDQLEGNSDIELRDVGNGIRRYGADPVFIEDVSEQQSKADDADLPPWIGTALPAQPARTHRSVTSLVYKPKDQGPRTMTPAAAYGIAIHAFLRYMPAVPGDARRDYAIAAAKRLGIDSSEAQNLAVRVSQPDLQPYFAEGAFTEVELLGSHAGSETLIGRIDRLRLTEDAIYLIDYKTDQLPPPELTANHPYVQQIAVYSQCVTDSHPGLPHHVALFWTRTGRVDVLPPGLLTRACELALAAAPADEP
jgi:ATP-dependent helicase/nuclease subunit A